MAQVVAYGKVFEVCDSAIEVSCYGLRSYLQGKYGNNNKAKIFQVRVWLRENQWKPVEVESLKRVLTQLQTEVQ